MNVSSGKQKNQHCPCGIQYDGHRTGFICPRCGRLLICWSGPEYAWFEHPAFTAQERIVNMGRGHFARIHRDVGRLERKIDLIMDRLKVKRKKGRPRGI